MGITWAITATMGHRRRWGSSLVYPILSHHEKVDHSEFVWLDLRELSSKIRSLVFNRDVRWSGCTLVQCEAKSKPRRKKKNRKHETLRWG
mmetsp:Transcript_27886/g.64604  ORF Transcript_27886/g.64604 Transcript_27886/m.64604 type:complete len:90 (-) Transcript_27886:293-562(-)